MMSVPLDGFVEGPDRELDWHMVEDELHSHLNEQLGAMGAFLSGRVTYELMAEFWPTADTDPSSTGPMGTSIPSSSERGRTLFQPSDARIELGLAETRTFGNGVVLLRYRRRGA